MLIKKKIIIFIILSVGLLPTDIFLYAQVNKKLELVERLLNESKIDSLQKKMQEIFKDSSKLSQPEKANLYFLIGKYNDKINKEEVAIAFFRKSEELYKKFKNKQKLADIQLAKFQVLISRKNLEVKNEAASYLKKYFDYAVKNDDKKRLIEAYMGYASQNINPSEYEKALMYYDKAIAVCEKIKDTFSLARINNNKGIIISNFHNNLDSARIFYKKSLKFYVLLNYKEKVFEARSNIGNSFIKGENYKEALKWFHQADSISIVNNKNKLRRNLYGLMAYSYEKNNDYKKAYAYLEQFLKYKNEVDVTKQNIAISDIQTKYQTAEKELENSELRADKKRQQLILLGVLGTFIAFLIVGFLSYMNLQRKRELAEKEKELGRQKVMALIKEQELRSMDAMIEGQEKERKRIAEDLHDNLGSKLAVLKLQFDSFVDLAEEKKDFIQIERLKKTGNLLDDTYNTVRSMSHVENEEGIISKHGLVESVKVLAENISMANKTEIQVIDFGLDIPINRVIEIGVFRIIQELVTNIVKHSNANKATIDLTLFDDVLGVIVADDGVGFDIDVKKKTNTGMGLGTIDERIKRLNGHLTVDSNQGRGTTIIIELPISNQI